MYYCQHILFEEKNRSAILLRKSSDLENWDEAIPVYVDLEFEDKHSKLESPFVIKEREGYYLFIRNRHLDENTSTVVLFSKNPEKFPSGIRTWFTVLNNVHAPEIIHYNKDLYFIVRVCCRANHAYLNIRQNQGWLEIAKLEFR